MWNLVWALWLGGLLAFFGVAEGLSLANKLPGDTFSETLRRWLGLEPRKPWRQWGMLAFTVLFGGFAVWFEAHILGGLL